MHTNGVPDDSKIRLVVIHTGNLQQFAAHLRRAFRFRHSNPTLRIGLMSITPSAEIAAWLFPTTLRNAASSAISTVSFDAAFSNGGRRVHKITLFGLGSPDAAPSGKRSLRSFQLTLGARPAGTPPAAKTPADQPCPFNQLLRN